MHLRSQGIEDEVTIQKQLLLYQWEQKKIKDRRARGRKDINDPKAHSIHVSQMSSISDISDMSNLAVPQQ